MANSSITPGSTVQVRLNGQEKSLTIVDPESIDPQNGHISFNSPIAQALLGAGVGEQKEIKLPTGSCVTIEIMSVA